VDVEVLLIAMLLQVLVVANGQSLAYDRGRGLHAVITRGTQMGLVVNLNNPSLFCVSQNHKDWTRRVLLFHIIHCSCSAADTLC